MDRDEATASRLFGLPVLSSRWLGDHVLVPNSYMTVNEMRLAMPSNYTSFGNYVVYGGSATTSTSSLTFNYDEYGSVVVSNGPTHIPAVPKTPKPETDMAWLKRRVAEVSWVPA